MASQRPAVPAGVQEPKIALERAIGTSSLNNAAFCLDRNTGNLAYAAGCVVVIYSPRKAKQVKFLVSSQTVHSLAFTGDGEHIAAGQRGRKPSIQIWNVTTGSLRCTLSEHSYGVAAIAFSPDGRLLASAGFKNDRALHIWDWRAEGGSGRRVATGKLSQRVLSMAWRGDANVLVTAGEKHLKFWPFEPVHSVLSSAAGELGNAALLTLTSKPAVLSEAGPAFENFVGVTFGFPDPSPAAAHTLYAVTTGGMLVAFDEGRLMEQWVHTKARHGFCLDAVPGTLFVGCSDGIVRAFSPGTLAFRGTLPSPPPIGSGNLAITEAMPCPGPDDVVPAALAVRATADGRHVAALYGDRSLFLWDCVDPQLERILKVRSMTGHAGPIWDIVALPRPPPVQEEGGASYFPDGTFATASSDCTVRLWNMNARASLSRREALGLGGANNGSAEAGEEEAGERDASGPSGSTTPLPYARPRSIVMREQLRVLYCDDGAKRDGEEGADGQRGNTARAGRPAFPPGANPTRCIITAPFDIEGGGPGLAAEQDTGSRSIGVHPSGRVLATGDKAGNVSLFDLSTCSCVGYETAHDAEITSLSFTGSRDEGGWGLLASSSRDRFVHVFDCRAAAAAGAHVELRAVATLPHHKSGVTCVRFSRDGSQLVSGALDGLLIFHKVEGVAGGPGQEAGAASVKLTRTATVATPHGTILDFDIDAGNRNLVAAGSGTDRSLHVWSMKTGKAVRSYRAREEKGAGTGGVGGDESSLNRVVLDPSGLFVAAACGDRVVRLLDVYTGACIGRAVGHGELVTGLAFTHDCRRMLTAGADGIILVWKLSGSLQRSMLARLAEISAARGPGGVAHGGVVAVPPALPALPPTAPMQLPAVLEIEGSKARPSPRALSVDARDGKSGVGARVRGGGSPRAVGGRMGAAPPPTVPRSASIGRVGRAAAPPPVAPLPPPALPPSAQVHVRMQAGAGGQEALTLHDLDGGGEQGKEEAGPKHAYPLAAASTSLASTEDDPSAVPVEFRQSTLPAWAQTGRLAVGGGIGVGSSTDSVGGGGSAFLPVVPSVGGGLRPTSRWAAVVGTTQGEGGGEGGPAQAPPPPRATPAAAASLSGEDKDSESYGEGDDGEGEAVPMPKSVQDRELTRDSFSVSRGPGSGIEALRAGAAVRGAVAAMAMGGAGGLGRDDEAGSEGGGYGFSPTSPAPGSSGSGKGSSASPARTPARTLPPPLPASPASPWRGTGRVGGGGGRTPASTRADRTPASPPSSARALARTRTGTGPRSPALGGLKDATLASHTSSMTSTGLQAVPEGSAPHTHTPFPRPLETYAEAVGTLLAAASTMVTLLGELRGRTGGAEGVGVGDSQAVGTGTLPLSMSTSMSSTLESTGPHSLRPSSSMLLATTAASSSSLGALASRGCDVGWGDMAEALTATMTGVGAALRSCSASVGGGGTAEEGSSRSKPSSSLAGALLAAQMAKRLAQGGPEEGEGRARLKLKLSRTQAALRDAEGLPSIAPTALPPMDRGNEPLVHDPRADEREGAAPPACIEGEGGRGGGDQARKVVHFAQPTPILPIAHAALEAGAQGRTGLDGLAVVLTPLTLTVPGLGETGAQDTSTVPMAEEAAGKL